MKIPEINDIVTMAKHQPIIRKYEYPDENHVEEYDIDGNLRSTINIENDDQGRIASMVFTEYPEVKSEDKGKMRPKSSSGNVSLERFYKYYDHGTRMTTKVKNQICLVEDTDILYNGFVHHRIYDLNNHTDDVTIINPETNETIAQRFRSNENNVNTRLKRINEHEYFCYNDSKIELGSDKEIDVLFNHIRIKYVDDIPVEAILIVYSDHQFNRNIYTDPAELKGLNWVPNMKMVPDSVEKFGTTNVYIEVFNDTSGYQLKRYKSTDIILGEKLIDSNGNLVRFNINEMHYDINIEKSNTPQQTVLYHIAYFIKDEKTKKIAEKIDTHIDLDDANKVIDQIIDELLS